ncbi:MAG: hypothetical protein J6F33_05990 [Acidaminococcaceae bacterium]|nr:hypothetical protein [Acidaminococcaceae bacterium]
MTANEILHAIADLILAREASNNKIVRAGHLEQAVYFMAIILRIYCKQQGKNCEHCVFRLEDPDRKACECKINIGKNESGTAPRFWELVEKREADEKTQEPLQSGVPGQEAGVSQ